MQPQFDYPLLAREGWVYLCIALLVGLLATWWLGFGAIFFWLLGLLVLQFFRDPKRVISPAHGAIVAPASGKVVAVATTDNPYQNNEKSLKISIFMNIFSVHSNLIPISGTVKNIWYHPGRFVNAALAKSSAENERNAIHIRTPDRHDVYSVQIAGLIARRILCYVKSGDSVRTGQRYGFIRFGSRVEVYLPVDSVVAIKLGQSITSGNDILGFLPDPANPINPTPPNS